MIKTEFYVVHILYRDHQRERCQYLKFFKKTRIYQACQPSRISQKHFTVRNLHRTNQKPKTPPPGAAPTLSMHHTAPAAGRRRSLLRVTSREVRRRPREPAAEVRFVGEVAPIQRAASSGGRAGLRALTQLGEGNSATASKHRPGTTQPEVVERPQRRAAVAIRRANVLRVDEETPTPFDTLRTSPSFKSGEWINQRSRVGILLENIKAPVPHISSHTSNAKW